MSKKTLNKANLEKLGAEALSGLVMDLVQGNAALQRRARMELSAAQGPKEVAADLRKRFASLRRATSHVDWQKQRALVKDLRDQLKMIETVIAPHDANLAFELLWAFLQLAPSIHQRADDSNGAIGDVMREAVELIATLAPRLDVDPSTLAERILDAVTEADFGEFDGIIPATAEALDDAGLSHLKQITDAWAEAPLTEAELATYRRFGVSSQEGKDAARRSRTLTRSVILADVADAQGDVDAYMARYTAEQLTYGTIAPDVARRLLDAGRVEEAFQIVQGARADTDDRSFQLFRHRLDPVYEECLEKLGRHDVLKAHLWETFAQTLSARCLRAYLGMLPDFEDMEAEEKALDLAEAHPHLRAALGFLLDWPAQARAARLVVARAGDLDGNAYERLTPAAETLETEHPLAATLLRRAMITDTLEGAKTTRYRHAARHLAACKACDPAIPDHGDVPGHEQFVAALRQKHGRKHRFWHLVDD